MNLKVNTKFKHAPVDVPKIEQINTPDGRKYKTNEDKLYPSITTVLSVLSEQTIQNWKERIGTVEANKISEKARVQGTSLHELIEKYLNNEHEPDKNDGYSYWQFLQVKKYLDKINNIACQETSLWSDIFKVAGTTDCIAEYDFVPSVIDFKTSKKYKQKEWIEHYFIQGTFYALAYEEITGIVLPQVVVIIAGNDGSAMAYAEPKNQYIDKLIETIDEYTSTKEYRSTIDK